MKYSILLAVLLLLAGSAPLMAQEHDGLDPDEIEHQIFMKHQELELKELEAKLEFRNQERQLELERMKMELEHQRRKMEGHGKHGGGGGAAALFLIVCFVINVLATIWVYMDIRQRDSGSGIWIVITLLAGLFGALIYGIMRVGDIKAGDTGRARK
jgi:hypothetical protein